MLVDRAAVGPHRDEQQGLPEQAEGGAAVPAAAGDADLGVVGARGAAAHGKARADGREARGASSAPRASVGLVLSTPDTSDRSVTSVSVRPSGPVTGAPRRGGSATR